MNVGVPMAWEYLATIHPIQLCVCRDGRLVRVTRLLLVGPDVERMHELTISLPEFVFFWGITPILSFKGIFSMIALDHLLQKLLGMPKCRTILFRILEAIWDPFHANPGEELDFAGRGLFGGLVGNANTGTTASVVIAHSKEDRFAFG